LKAEKSVPKFLVPEDYLAVSGRFPAPLKGWSRSFLNVAS
jgi:hypothetical protein